MNAFLWTVIVIFTIDIIYKTIIISKQDDKRDLTLVPIDLVIMCGLLAWAIYLIGSRS